MSLVDLLRTQCAEAWSAAKATARLAIGLPDYDAYVEHMRARHPDATPMTREAFAVERMEARYGRGKSRCC
ncbi:YbdD/YjiX family protein [Lysobacter sp. A6]|uniref:YbdD/YjiX family protein n=1 Tax=Noviluteimonas lactosilytica TaxID=2888523 RepID=A0ABS8JKC2_9GAMM|nr:YbdD/YjiX family protein [Lysobacter lactosilyticus]MCC8363898.1 YbdD/YjiX family protein [Lysobacter lactosilyticus]